MMAGNTAILASTCCLVALSSCLSCFACSGSTSAVVTLFESTNSYFENNPSLVDASLACSSGAVFPHGDVEILVLQGPDRGAADRTDGDHANARDRVQQQRAAARVLLRNQAQRRGPKEGLAHAVQRRGQKQHHDARSGISQP